MIPDRSRPLGARLAALVLVSLIISGGLLACREAGAGRADASSRRDHAVVVGLPSAPIHLDPRVGGDQSSQRAYELLVDGLVERAPTGELVPSLATRWEIRDGGQRWRFHLRPGVRFHDGRPFSAADVAYTFGTLLDGTVASAKKGAFPSVARVAAVDPATVDFELREPFAALLADLTAAQGIVPVGMTPEVMNTAPVGTGPFRFVSKTPDRIELAASADHWRGRPLLDRVILREVGDDTTRVLELLHGSVDLVVNDLSPDVIPGLRLDERFQVIESPSANFAYLAFNFHDRALADVRVRRAIALGLDRPRLVATLWQGLGMVSETPFPPGIWGRHDALPVLPHDPVAARRLLDEAGYPDPDGDGPLPRLRLELKSSTNEQTALQAQVLQGMLAEIGVDLVVRTYEFATFFADVNRGSFQMFTLVRTGALDPNLFRLILGSQSVPPNGQNRGFYANSEFDRLVDEAARTIDPAARLPLYLRAQEIFASDLPYVMLFIKTNFAVMPADLGGYYGLPGGELRSLRQMAWR
jgi:peptide/nickel transport system substrate-binding protein